MGDQITSREEEWLSNEYVTGVPRSTAFVGLRSHFYRYPCSVHFVFGSVIAR